MWRAGLRISEALAIQESDLDRSRAAVLVSPREGPQAPRGRDGPLGWEQLDPWIEPAGSSRCVPLVVTQRQLGRADLGITSVYLQGIDSAEIIDTVHWRPSPVIRRAGLTIAHAQHG